MPDLAVIQDFYKGIGESEYLGNGDIVNTELDWKRGIVRINVEPTNSSAGTVSANVRWLVKNIVNSNELWALDSDGVIYQGTAASELWTNRFDLGAFVGGGGAVYWKDHLITCRAQASGNSILQGYGPLSGSPSLYTISSSIDRDANWHPMIIGQDDIVYGGAGRYVFSLQEVAGQDFQAGTSATFTMTTRALDLPEQERVLSLGELGKNLMIGTWQGVSNIYDTRGANIYPWDRVSESYFLPLKFNKHGIQAQLNIDNSLYFIAGTEGELKVTDGVNVEDLAIIPNQIIDKSTGSFIEVWPGAMIHQGNKIIVGLRNPSGTTSQIWSYNLKTGAFIRENTTSSGTVETRVFSLLQGNNANDYWIGHLGNVNRIDHIQSDGSRRRYTDYQAYVTSPYLQIGSKRSPVVVSEIELVLAKALASGQGVRLSYRTSLGDGFTLIETVDFATYGGIREQTLSIQQIEVTDGIQIRAELTTGSGATDSPELQKIILR